MCLTIPKKIVEVDSDHVIAEDHNGNRQKFKSLIKSLQVGDFVLTQQNVVIEKASKKNSQEIFDMIKKEI